MKLLITGAHGQLGQELSALAADFGFAAQAFGSREVDIRDAAQVAEKVAALAPAAIINAAAYTAVDKAESDIEQAYAVNRDGPANLAHTAEALGIPLLHVSTDYVFDGSGTHAWRENDTCAPLGVYGASKLAGERAVQQHCTRHLILRTSWVFGVHGHNFVQTMLRLGAQRERLGVVGDQYGGPTPARDIARSLLGMARQALGTAPPPWGIYHYAGAPTCSWFEFAEEIFRQGVAQGLLVRAPQLDAIGTSDYPTPARRPANSRLDCTALEQAFGIRPPDWRLALAEMLEELPRNEGA